MKAKLRSGVFCCSSVFLLSPASYIAAQQVAQTPAAQPQQPAQPQVQQTPAPVSPPVIQEHDTGGDAFSIEPLYWMTKSAPVLGLGRASKLSLDSFGNIITPGQVSGGNLDFGGGSKYGLGFVVTVPTGKENSLEFSTFRIQGQGNTTIAQQQILFGNTFASGDLMSSAFKLENFKLSWNYLTFPYPSRGAKFRLKTLWEVQYMLVDSNINAPLDINAVPTTGNKAIFYPTFGIGIEYHPAKMVRLEAKVSGFGFPHHSDLWDAEASVVFRAGSFEAFLGGRAYHFKTSPTADQYFSDTLWGPSVGLRWMWR